MKILSFLLAVLFLFALEGHAQSKNIESEVDRLLRKRDVGELAGELAAKKSASLDELLIRLSVFARAGHRARVADAMKELAAVYSDQNRAQVFPVVKRAIAGNVAAERLFYEKFRPAGDADAPAFIDRWRTQSGSEEVEKWLQPRIADNDVWWNAWIGLKKERGAAADIAADLARRIRENPADFALVEKYLGALSTPTLAQIMEMSPINSYEWFGPEDVSWLADAFRTDSAYQTFALAVRLQNGYPLVAERLFKKSLAMPLTAADARTAGREFARYRFPAAQTVENPEKELRVWTKRALVRLYRQSNQPERAQTLVEELTADGAGDYYAAGAVQSATLARTVETRLLDAEKRSENDPAYWLDRVAYYEGRGDRAAVRDTYRKALEKFPYKALDWRASYPRYFVLYRLGHGQESAESTGILRQEFAAARAAGDFVYLYELMRILVDDYEEIYEEFFVNSELLPKVMAALPAWPYEEDRMVGLLPALIESAMESPKWNPRKRDAVWNELVALAARNPEKRVYALVSALTDCDEYRKAIPLLEKSLKLAPVRTKAAPPVVNLTLDSLGKPSETPADGISDEGRDAYWFDRDSLGDELLDAYLAVGEFDKAADLLTDGGLDSGFGLARLAVAAANKGKINDAARFWKRRANLDRRNLDSLAELAKTPAKTPLREFYERMKATDPLTDAPERALEILK
ncbi:MAG: hypothetical protein JSS81_24940 [Acidobacteria bacterium]|nr:hypothetical protein [Acidobacteriota bacterium]